MLWHDTPRYYFWLKMKLWRGHSLLLIIVFFLRPPCTTCGKKIGQWLDKARAVMLFQPDYGAAANHSRYLWVLRSVHLRMCWCFFSRFFHWSSICYAVQWTGLWLWIKGMYWMINPMALFIYFLLCVRAGGSPAAWESVLTVSSARLLQTFLRIFISYFDMCNGTVTTYCNMKCYF